MIPINMPRPGKPPASIVILVGIGKCGLSMPATLYEKMGKPTYLETYMDGGDLVLIPREVNGRNHSKKLKLTNTDRAFFYNRNIIKFCLKGHYLFSLSKSLTLRVKNCVKYQDEVALPKSNKAHPKTVFKKASAIKVRKKESNETVINEQRADKGSVREQDPDNG